MSQPKPTLLASSIAALLLIVASASPAGTAKPSLIRQVHLNGVTGPGYYSVVDGGYRHVRMPSAVAETGPAQVAEIADATPAN